MVNTIGDPFVHERVAAIRDALKAAGITHDRGDRVLERQSRSAQKLLTERLKANPKLVMVFSVDSVELPRRLAQVDGRHRVGTSLHRRGLRRGRATSPT